MKPRSFRAQSASASAPRQTGTRYTLPIVARTVFGANASAQAGERSAPEKPAASAVRSIVPTLPGSCTPSRTSSSPFSRESSGGAGMRTEASTPCGVFVSHTVSSTRAGTASTSFARAISAAYSSARSLSTSSVSTCA